MTSAATVILGLLIGCDGAEPVDVRSPPTSAKAPKTAASERGAPSDASLSGTLAWVAERDGVAHTTLRTLPDGPERAALPGADASFPAAFAPDGASILVITTHEDATGHLERLLRVPVDGSPPVELGAPAQFVRSPAWLPDGAGVVYDSSASSFRDLYRASATGGAAVRLTDAPHGSFDPAVSPDGATVAYVSSRDGNAELYTQPLAGGPAVRLTGDPGDDAHPAWRADGARLAWIATREGHARVWTMAADGSDPAPLRAGLGDDLAFAWAPDGRTLAVVTQVAADNIDLAVIDAVRGVVRADLGSPGVDENPAWSADGRWLAFASTRDGDPEVYVVGADGAGLRRLTTRVGPDWLPRWGR